MYRVLQYKFSLIIFPISWSIYVTKPSSWGSTKRHPPPPPNPCLRVPKIFIHAHHTDIERSVHNTGSDPKIANACYWTWGPVSCDWLQTQLRLKAVLPPRRLFGRICNSKGKRGRIKSGAAGHILRPNFGQFCTERAARGPNF